MMLRDGRRKLRSRAAKSTTESPSLSRSGHHRAELSFTFCGCVVNDLHAVIKNNDEWREQSFWDVFLAFDEGEYVHGPLGDPEEVFTKPMIANILREFDAAPGRL
jgi:hypothetical protein